MNQTLDVALYVGEVPIIWTHSPVDELMLALEDAVQALGVPAAWTFYVGPYPLKGVALDISDTVGADIIRKVAHADDRWAEYFGDYLAVHR